MLFHSFDFLIFFIIVLSLVFSFKNLRLQNLLLLFSSYIFYSYLSFRSFDGVDFLVAFNSSIKFVTLLFFTTFIDYICGIYISRSKLDKTKRLYVIFSIFVHLLILGACKYYNFFIDNIVNIAEIIGVQANIPTLRVILPVGISFYSFQSMSYSIDVYRKEIEPCRSFVDFCLFVSFFPQLIAGPIEKAKSLLPQIQQKRIFDYSRFVDGLTLFYLGLFKKIYIADNLASYLDIIGDKPSSGGVVYSIAFCYSLCLYFDFSAYTSMARGIAKILGFEIKRNFHSPFFSININDFFSRWHISLIDWLQDYIIDPLNRRGLSYSMSLFLGFVLMGLWHGASWNFVLWGGLSGVFLLFSMFFGGITKKYIQSKTIFFKLYCFFTWFLTLNLVITMFLFLYLDDMDVLFLWLKKLFFSFEMNSNISSFLLQCTLISSPILLLDILSYKSSIVSLLKKIPPSVKLVFLYVSFFLMVNFSNSPLDFIYFSF